MIAVEITISKYLYLDQPNVNYLALERFAFVCLIYIYENEVLKKEIISLFKYHYYFIVC